MIINKVITGFVVQTFDTETKKFTGQKFFAEDEERFEDGYGDEVDAPSNIPNLALEMIQPKN